MVDTFLFNEEPRCGAFVAQAGAALRRHLLAALTLVCLGSVPGSAFAQAAPPAPQSTASAPASAAPSTSVSPSNPASPNNLSPAAENKPDVVRQAWNKFRSLSIADLLDWIRLHGLPVLFVALAMTAILWVANRLHKRLVPLLARHTSRGTPAEQENRARTLVGVVHNTLRTTTVALGLIMILEEIGLPIGPLVGGVAVVGLAVAFGAQSLIKDYFTGFLVLLEQQYMIGDVIKIGAVTGQVEQITLRLTMLRDLEGAVHFIPHGQITFVSNLTHGWSQAVFDLNVPAGESVERIRDLFFSLCRELRLDADYGPMILGDPAMLGVDSLGEATCTIKFTLKTLPLKRWEVKRELLRRLKDNFQREQMKVTIPA